MRSPRKTAGRSDSCGRVRHEERFPPIDFWQCHAVAAVSRGECFAVDATYFEEVCDLGLNPALAYLVITSGTLKDLRTSAWSGDAVRRYSTMRWSRAKEAIDALQQPELH